MTRLFAILATGSDAKTYSEACESLGVPTVVPSDLHHPALLQSLDQYDLSAAVVDVPPSLRSPIIRYFLRRETAVIAPMPLAVDLASSLDLLQTVEHLGWKLLPISPFRAARDISLARGIMAGGAIGDPVRFSISLSQSAQTSINGSRKLYDLAWTSLDLMTYCFGEPGSLETFSAPQIRFEAQYASSLRGDLFISNSVESSRPILLTIEGTEGRIDVGWHGSFFCHSGGTSSRFGDGIQPVQIQASLLNHCLEVLRGDAPPWVTTSQCRRILHWINVAQQSLDLRPAPLVPERFVHHAAA